MNKLVEAIINRDFSKANEMFDEEISNIAVEKLEEAKKITNASEQITMIRKAFDGGAGARQEKLYRDVVEGQYNPNMDSEKETNKLAEDEAEQDKITTRNRINANQQHKINKLSNVRDSITQIDKDLNTARKIPVLQNVKLNNTTKRDTDRLQGQIDTSKRTIAQNNAMGTKTGFRGTIGHQNLGLSLDRQKAMSQAGVKEEFSIDELYEARIKIVKARIRGGKVQRRKKVSNVAGYTLRGGQLKRMSPMERRRRKLGQRKGKIKRKAKLQRSLIKRKRSLMRRKSIGLG